MSRTPALKVLMTEYNSKRSVASRKISDWEGMLMLPSPASKFIDALEVHWNNYKTADSAIPMKVFGMNTFSADISEEQNVWRKIFEPLGALYYSP